MWLVLFGILMAYFMQMEMHKAKEFERRGETIGDEIKKSGYIYCNFGDINNNENWVLIDKYEPIYYVNVYKKDDIYEIKIEDSFSEKAIDSLECEAEWDTHREAKIYEKVYSEYGTVIMDKEKMNNLVDIIKTDPCLKKRYSRMGLEI